MSDASFDIAMPDWMHGYDDYLLLKFMKTKKFQEDFLDGLLYFNTAEFFSTCDESGVGDTAEGTTISLNPGEDHSVTSNIVQANGHAHFIMTDRASGPILRYSSVVDLRRKIISMYAVGMNLKDNMISPFDARLAKEFGRYAVLIADRREFFRRVNDAPKDKENIHNLHMGFVEYRERRIGANPWDPYRKDAGFRYQNEFRMTFDDDDYNEEEGNRINGV